MLGIGIGEMVIIAGIALMVIGPEKFPEFAKIVVRTVRDLRGYVEEIQTEVTKELAPVKKELDKLNEYKPEEYIDSLMTEKSQKVAGQSEIEEGSGADPTDKQHDGSGSHPSASSTPPAKDDEDEGADDSSEEIQDQESPEPTAETGEEQTVETAEGGPEVAQDDAPEEEVPDAAPLEEDEFDNISPPERLD